MLLVPKQNHWNFSSSGKHLPQLSAISAPIDQNMDGVRIVKGLGTSSYHSNCWYSGPCHVLIPSFRICNDSLFLFSFCFRSPNISATFAVVWGGSKPLDNPDDIHVLIYRCKEMADNCGKCLSLDEKFQCGWCQSSNKCEVKEKCGNDASSWLNRDQTCPNPQVTSFLPMLGPWEGKSRRYKLHKGDSTIYHAGSFIYTMLR